MLIPWPSAPYFQCPKCSRKFSSWQHCNAHIKARKHGEFCIYDKHHIPRCLQSQFIHAHDPYSGWCSIEGIRDRMEDFHGIAFTKEYRYYGVFDGHSGIDAAKFSSRELHIQFAELINSNLYVNLADTIKNAFIRTNDKFLDQITDNSGTTATVALIYKDKFVIANVGDSRGVLCCDSEGNAVQVTVDHTPEDPNERFRIINSGAWVERKGVLRLNGQLAVTRAIGNLPFQKYLTSVPHVQIYQKKKSP